MLIDSLRNTIPYIKTRMCFFPKIFACLSLKSDSRLIDLGCGDGSVLRYCVSHIPSLSGYGIEQKLIPYTLAKIACARYPQISILRGDFFKIPLSSYSHIYVYLSADAMSALESKLVDECGIGTIIISCDFYFPNLRPKYTIDVASPKRPLGKKLFIYEL